MALNHHKVATKYYYLGLSEKIKAIVNVKKTIKVTLTGLFQ